METKGQLFRTKDFLPTSAKEVKERGWEELDIILFSGDAYVDHPSFGIAVIGRLLEAQGYRVAIVPQPNWRDDLRDFKKLGAPRLFFGISGGNMDSMVNHYTANKRLRSDDAYTPGGKAGFRPDYATTVYSRILKQLYPKTPVIIGGIEASLRRLTHYDYWQDKLKPSILAESGADILVYGMGDKVILDIAASLHNGFNINLIRKIKQIAFSAPKEYFSKLPSEETIFLHSYEECLQNSRYFGENFVKIETESNRMHAKRLVEPYGDKAIVVNPPYPFLTTEQLDYSFSLPYTRQPHPRYANKGPIPAYEMIKFSVNLHRGCFGGCSFCTISAHQGKFISSRSEKSILEEIEKIARMPDFKGYLSDLGGPSANMYRMAGKNAELCKKGSRPSCIYPSICKNLDNNHERLLKLYNSVNNLKYIKKAFIGSSIRYDLFDKETAEKYLWQVIKYHTSGRLKVAPEHTEDEVLKQMRKPSFDLFRQLNDNFIKICRKENLNYQLIPYFISSHPGCGLKQMQELSKKMQGLHFHLEQVQDFTPTPMTLSSVMFYTGINPYTQEKIFVEHNQENKKKQKNLFFQKEPNPSYFPKKKKRK